MKKLKAGIIGLGVGEQHIEGYRGHPNAEVISICDFSEETCEKVRQKNPGLTIVRDADEILKDPQIDVVSIATYDNFHFRQVEKAIRSGKHVFVEKPLCLTRDEAQKLRGLISENPKIRLSSNLILRKSARFIKVREWIRSGRFGEIFFLEADYLYGRLEKLTNGWRGDIDYYSVTLGGGIHVIDLLLWLSGEEVVEVSAYSNKFCSRSTKFRFDDFMVALLKFKSGMLAKVSANFGCVYPHFHDVRVFGTKATFVNDVTGARLIHSRNAAVAPEVVEEEYPGVHKGGLIPDFIASILGERNEAVDTEDVFRTMSVAFAIEESLQKGKPVPVKPL